MKKYSLSNSKHLKIAQISDLHQANPNNVIEILKEEKPDFILITGDLLERHSLDKDQIQVMNNWQGVQKKPILKFLTHIFYRSKELAQSTSENAYKLLEEASKIAPVFYSLGNHEWFFTKEDEEIFKKYNITLLDNKDIEYKGIHIGGLSTRYDLDWLQHFSQLDRYKILMMHHPEYYDRYIEEIDTFDLILSGHMHGGQIRIGKFGLFGPGQMLFPKYCHGKFKTKKGYMIVSSGLCNTVKLPRLGNPREVVIIEV